MCILANFRHAQEYKARKVTCLAGICKSKAAKRQDFCQCSQTNSSLFNLRLPAHGAGVPELPAVLAQRRTPRNKVSRYTFRACALHLHEARWSRTPCAAAWSLSTFGRSWARTWQLPELSVVASSWHITRGELESSLRDMQLQAYAEQLR